MLGLGHPDRRRALAHELGGDATDLGAALPHVVTADHGEVGICPEAFTNQRDPGLLVREHQLRPSSLGLELEDRIVQGLPSNRGDALVDDDHVAVGEIRRSGPGRSSGTILKLSAPWRASQRACSMAARLPKLRSWPEALRSTPTMTVRKGSMAIRGRSVGVRPDPRPDRANWRVGQVRRSPDPCDPGPWAVTRGVTATESISSVRTPSSSAISTNARASAASTSRSASIHAGGIGW